MKRIYALRLVFATVPAQAAPRRITLSGSGMSCAACPIAVKKALTKVRDVVKAEVDLGQQRATVNCDDILASPQTLAKAVTDAGYPAQPLEVK